VGAALKPFVAVIRPWDGVGRRTGWDGVRGGTAYGVGRRTGWDVAREGEGPLMGRGMGRDEGSWQGGQAMVLRMAPTPVTSTPTTSPDVR
jgi:hypothetical protein